MGLIDTIKQIFTPAASSTPAPSTPAASSPSADSGRSRPTYTIPKAGGGSTTVTPGAITTAPSFGSAPSSKSGSSHSSTPIGNTRTPFGNTRTQQPLFGANFQSANAETLKASTPGSHTSGKFGAGFSLGDAKDAISAGIKIRGAKSAAEPSSWADMSTFTGGKDYKIPKSSTAKVSSAAEPSSWADMRTFTGFEDSVTSADDSYAAIKNNASVQQSVRALDGYLLGAAPGKDAPSYDYYYKAAMGEVDRQLAVARKKYGPESGEVEGLVRFKNELQAKGRKLAAQDAQHRADDANIALDNQLRDIYGGLINTPEFASDVEKGREALEDDKDLRRLFEGEAGNPTLYERLNGVAALRKFTGRFSKSSGMGNASKLQQDLILAAYARGGIKEAKELYNDLIGNTVNYVNSARDYAHELQTNDSALGRFWYLTNMNAASGVAGQWMGGATQALTDTKADPNDRTILGDYSINDAIDDTLRQTMGEEFVNSPEFQDAGRLGLSYMRTLGVDSAWLKEVDKNASDFQKLMLGVMFYNSYNPEDNTFDEQAARAMWEAIKDQDDYIWQTVNGAQALPYNEYYYEGNELYNYLNLSGPKANISGAQDGETLPAYLWRLSTTTLAQGPQVAASSIAGAIAGAVAGAGNPATAAAGLAIGNRAGRIAGGLTMALSAYGNSYREAVNEGYATDKAGKYAAAEALSEFVTDQFLNGVGNFTGKLTGGLGKKVIERIADPLFRSMAKLGVNMTGEASQEGLQELIEPQIRKWTLGEEGVDFWSEENFSRPEILDAFIMGGLSAGIMDAGLGLGADVRQFVHADQFGNALNTFGSTQKLIDTVLNSNITPETKEQKEHFEEAKELAARLNKSSSPKSDINVGTLAMEFAEAGGDISWLTNPKTAVYNKDSLSTEDLAAGANSMLLSLGSDPSMAEDIAKMAKGQTVPEERQTQINNDPNAKTVLAQLQGDLDMNDNDNALTRAARQSTVEGAYAKVAAAIKMYNPDKTILSPSAEYLVSNAAMGVADAQRIGAVIDKVLDGVQITREEAKLLNMSRPGIQGAVLDRLGLDINSYAKVDAVMEELNKFAAEVAKTKDMQAGVQQATRNQTRVAPRKRGRGKPGVKNRGGIAYEKAKRNDTGRAGRSAQGARQEARAVGEGAPGGEQAVSGGRRTVEGQEHSVPGAGTERRVISPDKLTPEQRDAQRRAASYGASSVVFITGSDSVIVALRDENGKLIGYEIRIRADGVFSPDQYADHEGKGHLWLKALSDADRKVFLLEGVERIFGREFQDIYNQVKALYERTGKLEGLSEHDVDLTVREEMFALAMGGQNFTGTSYNGKKINDPDCHTDFSRFQADAEVLARMYNLEAMARGDMSNEAVKQNFESGNYNREFYEAQGLMPEATEKKQEAPKTPIPKAKTESAPQQEKAAASKEKSNAAKAFKPAKEEKAPAKEKPKANRGSKKNVFTPTAEAIERAKKLPNKERKALRKELVALSRQLRSNPELAEDADFIAQMKAWFDKAKTAVDMANTTAEEAAETPASPEDILRDEFSKTQAALQEKMAQLDANPDLENDPTFSAELQVLVEKGQDIVNRLEQMVGKVEELEAAVEEGPQEEAASEPATPETILRDEMHNTLMELQGMAERKVDESDPEYQALVAKRDDIMNRLIAMQQEQFDKSREPATAPARTTNSSFDYDEEFRKATEEYAKRRASQKRKLEKNPAKSQESYNAQLRKIQDEYNYKVRQLQAQAARNGDPRFASQAEIDRVNAAEAERRRNDQARFSAEPITEDEYGRRSDVRDLNTGRAEDDRRVQAGARAVRVGDGTGAGRGFAVPAAESRGRSSEEASASGNAGVSRSTGRRYAPAVKRGIDKQTHREAIELLKAQGCEIVNEADVPAAVKAAGDFVKSMLPGLNVSYYRDDLHPYRNSFFAPFKTSANVDGGIFINVAAFNENGVNERGKAVHTSVVHETGHRFLYYAAFENGTTSNMMAKDALRYLLSYADKRTERALEKALNEYAKANPKMSSSQVVEELIVELFARSSSKFKDQAIADNCSRIVREWFVNNTDFGRINSNDRPMFSVDPEVEELMDRSEEIYKDVNSEQILQNAGLAADLSTDGLYDPLSDSLSDRIDALTDQLEIAIASDNQRRIEEITAEMNRLYSEMFNETPETLSSKAERSESKAKAKTEKKAAAPKAETRRELTDAQKARTLELWEELHSGNSDREEAEIWNEMLQVQGLPNTEDGMDELWLDTKWKPEEKAETKLVIPKAEQQTEQQTESKVEIRTERPAQKARPVFVPNFETLGKAAKAKPVSSTIPLADVSGPFDVEGMTLSRARDKVNDERRKLTRKASLTAEEQARLAALTDQYNRLGKVIDQAKQRVSDPKAAYGLRIEGTEKNPVQKRGTKEAFQPKKAKAAPKSEPEVELKRPVMHRGPNPVAVGGLTIKQAAKKIAEHRQWFVNWSKQQEAKLAAQLGAGKLTEKQYGNEWGKLIRTRDEALARYDEQAARYASEENTTPKPKATKIEDDVTNYAPQTGKWWAAIGNAANVAVRRLRSDRNTYSVRLVDSTGRVTYLKEVSPSRLEQALGDRFKNKALAKERLAPVYEQAEKNLGEWQTVDNSKLVKTAKPKAELQREKDNYGQKIPVKLAARMENSKVRDESGRLVRVYRVGPSNGTNNANVNQRYTIWSERPATMNLFRGLNGAEAYDQAGKGIGANIEKWLAEIADENTSEQVKASLRQKLATEERKFREYTTHVTRLDPWRPGYTNANRADVLGGKTLLEGFVDIRNPMVVDAKGAGLTAVYDLAQQFIDDPNNFAGQAKPNGDPIGEYDGLKVTNVTVTEGDQTLGGGNLDRDTIYVTFRHNQGKSSYNTDPTDNDLMQYSVDPETSEITEYEGLYQLDGLTTEEAYDRLVDQENYAFDARNDDIDALDRLLYLGEITTSQYQARKNAAIEKYDTRMQTVDRLMAELEEYEKEFGYKDPIDISNTIKDIDRYSDITNHRDENYSVDPETGIYFKKGSLEEAIYEILTDKDEAHAMESLALLMSEFIQSGKVADVDNQNNRAIFQSRISPEERAILDQRARDLVAEKGRLRPGEKPAREVLFPKATEAGNVRRVLLNAAESKNTPERAVPYITREMLTNEANSYQPITDKAAIAAAHRDMATKGPDAMLEEWRAKANGDVEGLRGITKYDIAKAELLYMDYANRGDMETAMEVLAELAEVGTTAGQVVQGMRMLKSMPPVYQLYYMRRVVNRMNQQYSKRIDSGKMSAIKIDKNLARAVIKAKTQEDVDAAMDALIKNIAGQIPATYMDKWNAWRYLAMLGNPKTHIRNVFGNGIFAPVVFAKDIVAAGMESVFIRDRSKRSSSVKGVLTGVGSGVSALLGGEGLTEYGRIAAEDFEGIKKELQNGGKYNPTNQIMDERTIFHSKLLEALRTKNNKALEGEDGWFLKVHYITAMTNFLTAQGVDREYLQGTPEGRKIMNAARAYAFNEAQKATYRDASRVATALNQMKRNAGPIGSVLLEGMIPFTKTPINILKRGVEYSPIGLLQTITADGVKLAKGDINANEFIDHLASGLTGTGVLMLGMYLAKMGLLHGGDDDDDKQADFNELQGVQNYSIDLGDGYNYTIDWAAPVALPLFVGAELYNEFQEGNGLSKADYLNALTVIAEPITQLSMLSGLNETLKSAKWDDNPLSSILMLGTSGYVSQALPTILAQVSRSLVEDRRTTYIDKNSDTPQALQRWWQTNVLGKTPLNSQRTEYIDAWGRKDTESNFAMRLFENMFSPGYLNKINTTPVDAELQRLADEVGTGVLMTVPKRSIEFDHQTHNLTAEQYATYAKARGDQTMTLLADLFDSQAYQENMTDTERAYAVDQLMDYANILGKQAVFDTYETTEDNWAEKCDGDVTRLVNMAMLRARAKTEGVAMNTTDAFTLIYQSNWLSPVDQAYMIAQLQNLGSTAFVYEKKGSPKYALTSEGKVTLQEHYRQIFPAYYLELVQSDKWQNADTKTRDKLLSDVRADANADAKSWLAHILAQTGGELYVKPD